MHAKRIRVCYLMKSQIMEIDFVGALKFNFNVTLVVATSLLHNKYVLAVSIPLACPQNCVRLSSDQPLADHVTASGRQIFAVFIENSLILAQPAPFH
jgi:hypothetical protein